MTMISSMRLKPRRPLLPVPDVVSLGVRVGTEGPEIIAIGVAGARVKVLVGLAPWILRKLLDVGAFPLVRLPGRSREQGVETGLGRRVAAHVDPVLEEGSFEGVVDKLFGDIFLGSTKEVANPPDEQGAHNGNEGDDNEHLDKREAR